MKEEENVTKNCGNIDDGTKPLYFIYGNKFNRVVSKIAYLVGKSGDETMEDTI